MGNCCRGIKDVNYQEKVVLAQLPQDLIIEVLMRLPLKSLLRFRCVSKSLCAFIDSQYYTNSHMIKSAEVRKQAQPSPNEIPSIYLPPFPSTDKSYSFLTVPISKAKSQILFSIFRRSLSRVMRRRRDTVASNAKRRRNEAGKVSRLQANYSGPSFSDLPSGILVNILLRLCVKRILVCKCVCKTWYDLISSPEFAKIHHDQAEIYPLLRTSGYTLLSRMLYLVQPEHDDFGRIPKTGYKSYEIEPGLKIRLDAKLKLPLRNIHMINHDSKVEGNKGMKLNMKNHKYRIVNSRNGLLCLSDPSDNDPVIVCNPVTGEFINLPEVRTVQEPGMPEISCGLGFSPVTKQYKVIRMFTRWIDHINVMVAEVNILGTNSWKDLGHFPQSIYKLHTTYLNGCVYWYSPVEPHCVICFDVECECFESISPPHLYGRVSMGVLGGELFISEAYGSFDPVRLWALKDHGPKKAWFQVFTFNASDHDRWPYGSYQPIKYRKDGSLLLFHSQKRALICKHPKRIGFRYWKVCGLESKVEAIAHVPSLVSLNHSLSGNNTEVLNIRSRCGELKLHKETKGIYIVEEDRDTETDTEYDRDFD